MVLAAAVALAGLVGAASAQDDRLAVLETGHGQIVIEFFSDDAPNHVENFVSLAESGSYDGTLFHRIISGFMIQGGDPNTISGDPGTWGGGGPDENVDAEFNTIKHIRGIVSMARSGHPDSAGSQFFIVHADTGFLDGQYTVFGRIVTDESFETLDRIAQTETNARDAPTDPEPVRITSVTITDRSKVLNLLDLPEPERTQDAPEIPDPEPVRILGFNSTELGVRFTAPPGWMLPRISPQPGAPDAVTIDPKLGSLPVIALRVDEHQKTFDEMVSDRDVLLEDLKDAGYEVLSQEKDTLNGLPTYVITVTGPNPLNPELLLKTQEVTVYTPDKLYIMEYAHHETGFEDGLTLFTQVLESLEIEGNDPGSDSGGCLIATATFGSELAPQVQQLRELRDNTVLSTQSGSAFMDAFNSFYYSFSPAIADLEREHPVFREGVKAAITPMLATLSILNHAGIDSEAEMMSYGAGVILLNIGMYVAAPAVAAYQIRRIIIRKSGSGKYE
ncbi:MAG: peptidylprolyl isomerase [Nitrosopumilus sp. B06]|nr:MAG: peptidylprolyl isomerase [Nitrosopumilus sp. D6]RNJ80105.1 MAG: peptidylprolyl isomerase [Nitrosopumilus sp. B06]